MTDYINPIDNKSSSRIGQLTLRLYPSFGELFTGVIYGVSLTFLSQHARTQCRTISHYQFCGIDSLYMLELPSSVTGN